MVNNNTIKRDSVFIGQVVKLNTVKIKDNKFIPDIYSVYRSILFTIDDDGLSNDLIYDSPKYAVLNYADNDIYWSNMLKETKHRDFDLKVVVINTLNIGILLKKLGFSEQLTKSDIDYIKRVVFNKKILEDKCYQFGLVPAYNKKSIGWYNKDIKKTNYTMGPTKLYYEMEPYRDAINEFGSDKKISILKKGVHVNLDAFKPSRKEGKVKKKVYER